MKPPRIAFVAPNLYPVLTGAEGVASAGGAEVQQTMIIRALRDRGYSIGVVTGDFGQPDVVHWDGIRIDKMPAPAGRGIKGLRFVHPRLTDCVAALRRQAPDIVYNRVAGGYLAACAWYCQASGARLVYASASDLEFKQPQALGFTWRDRLLFRWGLRHAERIVVQNTAQQEMLRTRVSARSTIIPSGYDEAQYLPGRFDGEVLFVGTIKPLKRPEHFIDIARQLPSRRFKLIGPPGPGLSGTHYASDIERIARQIPNLDYVGFVPFAEVGRHFDGASLLINTSQVEGFPNTFLQAWIRGVPTVSYVAPQTLPGQTGTVAAADPAALADAVRELLSSEFRWSAASRHCREHFLAHHALKRVAESYDAVFATS